MRDKEKKKDGDECNDEERMVDEAQASARVGMR